MDSFLASLIMKGICLWKIEMILWTHHDYFDQKALSKAQAEYNYYRTIEGTWKKTVSTHSLINIYLFIYFGTSLNASVV